MSNITKDQVIEWLSAQPVLELAALVKDLEGLLPFPIFLLFNYQVNRCCRCCFHLDASLVERSEQPVGTSSE